MRKGLAQEGRGRVYYCFTSREVLDMKTFGYFDDDLLRSVLVYSIAERSGATNKRLCDN
jgi:hypothetical protein